MKTSVSLIALMMIVGIFLLQASRIIERDDQDKLIYPAEVRKIIDQKCHGCHSVKGSSKEAKEALMWDSLPNLEKRELVATLDEIIEVLEKDKMPPEEIVKKYPEAKLLPKEKEMLKSWAEAKADSIIK
jgi:mono/diheme cytochrome c family protein